MKAPSKLVDSLVSPIFPLALIALAAFVIRPWGEFPINDDWQYTHIASRFAATGTITIDRPIAPAIITQTLFGGLLIKLFGVSHVLMRAATFILSLGCLALLDLLLRRGQIGKFRRAAVLLVIGFNPIGFVCSLSFMTEVYGTLPAVAAMLVWCSAPPGETPTLARASLATILASLAYLNRQFSGLILPALILVSFFEFLRAEPGRRTVRSLFPLAFAGFVFIAAVGTHWLWNKGTGNETIQLANPMSGILAAKGAAWTIMGGVSVFYFAGFCAPLLLIAWTRPTRKVLISVALAALAVGTLQFSLNKFHGRHKELHYTINKTMPYLTNVIVEGGIGPFTTTDVYVEKGTQKPRMPLRFWEFVQYGLFALAALFPVAVTAVLRGTRTSPMRTRIALVGATFFFLTMIASLQVYGYDLFDRYLWTPFIGLAICLAMGLPDTSAYRKLHATVFLVVFAPIFWFTVAGTHDYFSWQRARWSLYSVAQATVSPLSIDGGYEPNGWFAYDDWRAGKESPSCVAICRRNPATWYVVDDSFRIGHTSRRGDIILDRVQPRTWLTRCPQLVLSRRADP